MRGSAASDALSTRLANGISLTDMTTQTHLLTRPDGDLGYTDTGHGPLLVLVPGMGDTVETWRDVAGPLAAEHRVVACDLRGHGRSGTTFRVHGDDATGADLVALIEHLDAGPAVLVGNSMGASAAVWAAATRPDLVAGLVLVSPFVSERPVPAPVRAATRLAYRLLFSRPWGAWAWSRYYAGPLSRGTHAPWLAEHAGHLRAHLHEPGRLRSLRELAVQLDHSVVAQVVDRVTAPAVVLIGEHDPDYPDAPAALAEAGAALGARTVLVEGVAHYAQHQAPGVVLDAARALLADLARAGDRWSRA